MEREGCDRNGKMSRQRFLYQLGWGWNAFIVLISSTILCNLVVAQNNLVANGSFENRTDCPYYVYELQYCSAWSGVHSTSPDYFHRCSEGNAGVPANFFGYENTLDTDSAYTGIGTYSPHFSGGQEILAGTISTPLEAGNKYRVRFKVSMADFSQYLTSCVGAVLSANLPPIPPFDSNLSDVEIVISPSEYNTEDWYQLDAVYTAEGGEDKIFIASFRPENEANVVFNDSGTRDHAYFYIDDVEIYEDTITGIAEDGLQQVSITVDPISQRIVVRGGSVDVAIELYDMAGKLLTTGGQQLNTNGLTGFYVVRVMDRKGNLGGVKKVVLGL